MKYRSTRGGSPSKTFKQVVLQGLSPDGGLYLPEYIPTFSLEAISSWRKLKFPQLAFQLFRPFISLEDVSDSELATLCDKSFSTFTHPDITPTVKLPTTNSMPANSDLLNLYVLELFHGPTFAFKDVALQFLGNLFELFLKKGDGKRGITVLGATSGDTGGAAIYGLRGKENINVFILHPHKRVSPIQEAQMTSVLDSNVYNVAIEGSFDDCQDIVKALFSDSDFKEEYQLGAVNSINWARILAQTTYYFYSYFSVLNQLKVPMDVPSFLASTKIQFSVPTGNFGDVLAGFYAKQMGLPIYHFIVATNENDILDRFLKTGRYEKHAQGAVVNKSDPVKQTLSPAMDILISSNFERLLWYICQDDQEGIPRTKNSDSSQADAACRTISEYFNELKRDGTFQVSVKTLEKARALFSSYRVDDLETSKAIQRYYHTQYSPDGDQGFYILDPHTAVGVVAAEHILEKSNAKQIITVCLSTASPGKFPNAVLASINDSAPAESVAQGFAALAFNDIAPQALIGLEERPRRMTIVAKKDGNLENALNGVRKTIEETLRNSLMAKI